MNQKKLRSCDFERLRFPIFTSSHLLIFSTSFLYCLLFTFPSFAWESQETVRVAIFKGTAVSVGGEGIAITGMIGSNKVSIRSSDGIETKAGRDGIVVNGTSYSSLEIESKESGIKVNGKRYRGKIEIVKDNSSLILINELNLEDYLVGLINQEISSKWPMEAVKAQAVVARTYALYQKNNRKYPTYDLESTVASQVYSGIESEDELARQAVKETEGEVAYYNGEMIQALYHSSCGGKTEDALEVWGKEIPYLKSIKDPHCTEAPNYFWQYNIDMNGLRNRLMRFNGGIGEINSVSILKRSRTGRVTSISVRHSNGSFELPGKDFREALGFENIRSTDFTLKIKGDSVYFAGSGGGHGVGMCQWGAKGMAEEGKSYKDILKWYYPGVTIKRMNGS
ncbi:MAG: putative cell division protein, SpoIID family [Deltaproteobacteria bacterium]|nr:putative cell division protein, SpoIID family [Deltaproteobacteria bacterium]